MSCDLSCSLVYKMTLLFMGGFLGDAVSSIDVSTAFFQAEEDEAVEAGSMPRYVYYQATQGANCAG